MDSISMLNTFIKLHLGYELFPKFSLSDVPGDPAAAPLRGGLPRCMTVPPQAPPPPTARCTPSAACPCCCPLQLHASGPRWSHVLLAAAVHCWEAVAAAVLRAALARGAGGVLPAPLTGDRNCLMDSCVAPAPNVASSACRFKTERGCACSMYHCPAQHLRTQLHPERTAWRPCQQRTRRRLWRAAPHSAPFIFSTVPQGGWWLCLLHRM